MVERPADEGTIEPPVRSHNPSINSVVNREFFWPIRVYYEDTDAGGVVYYANYLAYMERARTEWLRTLGFDNSGLAQDPGVVFAVRRVALDYLRPARLDDELRVSARVAQVGRASLTFDQEILLDGQVLCRGTVKLACVDTRRFRPAALPRQLLDKIDTENQPADDKNEQ